MSCHCISWVIGGGLPKIASCSNKLGLEIGSCAMNGKMLYLGLLKISLGSFLGQGSIRSCRFLRIFTYTYDGLFFVRLGKV